MLGRGLSSGTQSQLNFLRVQHTDYIFAVLGEELGFVGGVIVIGLYAILLMQIISIAGRSRDTFGRLIAVGIGGMLLFQVFSIAGRSRDTFGRLIAVGIGGMLLFQVFVNIGMNIGLSPVTGIPLPFISYGRSSLLTLLICVGLLESIAWRRRRDEETGVIQAERP
jgi:rod shape determining protein RodA